MINPRPLPTFVILWPNVAKGKKHVLRTIGSLAMRIGTRMKLHNAKWTFLLSNLCLKENDRMLLIIDDTYNEKEGTQTEGVGKFYDHSKETYIWGNNFVTSVIQSKGLFMPHKAKMYIKNDDENENFRTKMEIAFDEIIEPLEVPKSMDLYIVFDSWCCVA